MKTILSLLIISQLFICSNNEKKNSVIGNWSFLIAAGYNCYTCPKIEFETDGTGKLILSAKEKIKFNYELLPGNKIKFDFNKEGTQSFFKQSEVFYYEFETIDNEEYFNLLDIKDRLTIHSLIR